MGYVITCPLPKLYGKLLSYSGALPMVQDRTAGVNDSYDSEKGTHLKDPQLKGKYPNLIKLTRFVSSIESLLVSRNSSFASLLNKAPSGSNLSDDGSFTRA